MLCPVCGNDTFIDDDYEYEICKECFWEYDDVQVDNPDYEGGANRHSLNDYKKIYFSLKKSNPLFSCTNKEDRDLIIKINHGEIEAIIDDDYDMNESYDVE